MGRRSLVVVADDYGIGPATSAGILRLCRAGAVTGTVLLVNSPYAAEAVVAWKQAAVSADLGWHPCLTLDAPILPASQVPSLVGRDGRFATLGGLMIRVATGRLRFDEVVAEFRAQLDRYRELTGCDPDVVNSHHHVQVFPVVGTALRAVLASCRIAPYLRRVREPWSTIRRVPGARLKRTFLSSLGRLESRRQASAGFPGNNWLAGITDPACVHDPAFFGRWLAATPGQIVELTCHPGDRDETILERDAAPGDGNLERRVRELELLSRPTFRIECERTDFRLVRPSQLAHRGLVLAAAG